MPLNHSENAVGSSKKKNHGNEWKGKKKTQTSTKFPRSGLYPAYKRRSEGDDVG